MRTLHRENCNAYIRDAVTDALGRTIVLSGRHAFEWSISICVRIGNDLEITTTTYSNGSAARKAFYNKYKKKR